MPVTSSPTEPAPIAPVAPAVGKRVRFVPVPQTIYEWMAMACFAAMLTREFGGSIIHTAAVIVNLAIHGVW